MEVKSSQKTLKCSLVLGNLTWKTIVLLLSIPLTSSKNSKALY